MACGLPHPSFGHPPQMRHLNLGRDSKYTGRIWRGIGFEIFLLQDRVHACASQRKRWALIRYTFINFIVNRSDGMNLKQITSSTISLIVAAILLLVVGTYTENSGFQLAGAILLTITIITGFNQARKRDSSD